MNREPPPGLQAERTGLAWERTAVGALATALLLALRVPAGAQPVALVPAGAALLLALAFAAIGRRRGRVLATRAQPVPAASAAVVLAGTATAGLGLLIFVLSVA